MAEFVNVTGLAELQAFLDTIAPKMEQNIMRAALRQGANVIKVEAQAQLAAHGNVKTELLSKGMKVSTRAKGGVVTANLKVKGKHGYIAHWIEFTGAAPHIITPKNAKALSFAGREFSAINHPGFQPKPFLRPAMDGKAGAAVVAVGEAIKKRLTKEGIDTADVDIGEV